MTAVYVSLGSNLDDPLRQVLSALRALENLRNTRLLTHSPWYSSTAIGPKGQPDYINGVAKLDTGLEAHTLLQKLQDIEKNHGRQRTQHWGPRTLDLDILLYGEEVISTDLLRIPHPQMHLRNFVLYPLSDIEPELNLPKFGPLESLLQTCSADGLKQLDQQDIDCLNRAE